MTSRRPWIGLPEEDVDSKCAIRQYGEHRDKDQGRGLLENSKENSQYIVGIKASASVIDTRGEDTRPQAMDPVQGRVKF